VSNSLKYLAYITNCSWAHRLQAHVLLFHFETSSTTGMNSPDAGVRGKKTDYRFPTISALSTSSAAETSALPHSRVDQSLPCNCGGKKLGRKLIVCIDGTSNRFGKNVSRPFLSLPTRLTVRLLQNSNVVEFYSHIDKSPEANQLTYYNSGIGTYVEPSLTSLVPFVVQWLDNHIDLAIAW
jgi:hypothetical protein